MELKQIKLIALKSAVWVFYTDLVELKPSFFSRIEVMIIPFYTDLVELKQSRKWGAFDKEEPQSFIPT